MSFISPKGHARYLENLSIQNRAGACSWRPLVIMRSRSQIKTHGCCAICSTCRESIGVGLVYLYEVLYRREHQNVRGLAWSRHELDDS